MFYEDFFFLNTAAGFEINFFCLNVFRNEYYVP